MEQPADSMDVMDFEEEDVVDEIEASVANAAAASPTVDDTDDVEDIKNKSTGESGADETNAHEKVADADAGASAVAGAGEQKMEAAAAPYEYPTGPVHIDQIDLLPANNLYDFWTSTPGVANHPHQDVALVLTFEGMGAQDLTVGLSHKPSQKGPMYQLIIGNKGNLQVDLEKRQGRRVEIVASTAGLLCAANKTHRYWVAVKHGRIDFGVGQAVGQHIVLSFRDTEEPIEVRYAGFTCLRHRALFTSILMEAETGDTLLPEAAATELEFIRAEGCDEGFSGEDKAALDSALELYQKECENMKRRAQKFGGTYAPPFLQDWVPWTLVKRLSWNRDLEGGIDRESKEEREKRKQRADRFGDNAPVVEAPLLEGPQNPLAKRVDPDIAEMITEEKRMARSHKFGNPDQMWSIQAEEQGLRLSDIFCEDPDRADPEPMASLFPHKIHIFSLDKTVCKQIRDNDVKAYFDGFGPKYVEWLSDWSFNVVFQDEDEAKTAAASKSFALPESLPADIRESVGLEEGSVEMGEMGWRLGVPMCKVRRDRFGPKGQWVRLLLRCAEAQDILLERPETPAQPDGPVLVRPSGSKLPPAVRDAIADLRGDDNTNLHSTNNSTSTSSTNSSNLAQQALQQPLSTSREPDHRGSGSGSGGGRRPRDRLERIDRRSSIGRRRDRDDYNHDSADDSGEGGSGGGGGGGGSGRRRGGRTSGGGGKRRRRDDRDGGEGRGRDHGEENGDGAVDLDPEDLMARALSAPREDKKRRGSDRDRRQRRSEKRSESSMTADEGAGPPVPISAMTGPSSTVSVPAQSGLVTPQT